MIPEKDKAEQLADELLIVRHSGEIPEVALHGSIYYLTQDPDGPRIMLEAKDIAQLKSAVVERYCEIIFRDLEPDNRDKGLYRGLARCVANWGRLSRFCHREGREVDRIRSKVAAALCRFIDREFRDVQSGSRTSCVNCTLPEFESLLAEIRLSPDQLPPGWLNLWQGG
jgi:hypothetical protein